MSLYNFKVVLLGQGGVGKTSLVLRYVSNVFHDSHESTLQASYLRKQLYLEHDLIKLNLWDTAGQEKFNALGPIFYREANGALLVYDVTSVDSLDRVRSWVKELIKILGTNNVRLAIIGNKLDLLSVQEQKRPQSNRIIQEAMDYSESLKNARHYLTSAKHSTGVAELFSNLAKRMIEQSRRQKLTDGSSLSSTTRSRYLQNRSPLSDDIVDDDLKVLDSYAQQSCLNSKCEPRPVDQSCQCFR